MQLTHFFLVEISSPQAPGAELCQAATQASAAAAEPLTLTRIAWNAELQTAYVYLQLAQAAPTGAGTAQSLQTVWQQALPDASAVKVSRLQTIFTLPGHSSEQQAVHHYVVETDADEGWMPEISRWYDTEHMPGLAAVPGCTLAMRLFNHDHGPLSHALYGLVDSTTLGSPAWLAVRGTEWSSRTRPHFVNTRRCMFRLLSTR